MQPYSPTLPSRHFFHGCVIVKWVPASFLRTLSHTGSPLLITSKHVQNRSGSCFHLFSSFSPLVLSRSCSLLADGSFISDLDKFLHRSGGLCWDLLYERLHASRLLVVPLFSCAMFLRSWLGSGGFLCPDRGYPSFILLEPWEVSPQVCSATAYALRDAIFVTGTRGMSMLDIFPFHFQQAHLFQ